MRHGAMGALVAILLGLAACQVDKEPAVEASAKPVVASPPPPAAAGPAPPAATPPAPPTSAAPLAAAANLTNEQAYDLLTRAVKSMECSRHWREAAGNYNSMKYGRYYVEAGVADELRDVAMRLAPEYVRQLQGMRAPEDEAATAQLHLSAISMAKNQPTMQGQLEPVAWMAYFSSRAAEGNCPPDADLLRLIGKQP